MQRQSLRRYLRSAVAAVVITILTAALAASASAAENSYTVTNLVSDVPGLAAHVDPDLVNGWGLTSLPTSPWWVADNGTDVSTLYRADGTKVPLTVQVPSAPTGAVSNTGPNFVVSNVSLSQAQVAVDHSDIGAVYKGLAIASTPGGDFLYATDFHNGRVDVFDGSFHQVSMPGAFVDPAIPAGYAPFGIQSLGATIVVTYAKQDAAREDDVAGQGHGFVDLFDTSGTFLRRVATHGQLNSPWGVAMAPSSLSASSGRATTSS